jgi:hypothetical protein
MGVDGIMTDKTEMLLKVIGRVCSVLRACPEFVEGFRTAISFVYYERK